MSKFMFQTGKTHRLRLVNAGGDGIQRFAIDGHKMTVIANDFVPVIPYHTDVVILGVGQRTDILVTATSNVSSAFWMRSNFTLAPCGIANQPLALAAIYYPLANTSALPKSTATSPSVEVNCGNVYFSGGLKANDNLVDCKAGTVGSNHSLVSYDTPHNTSNNARTRHHPWHQFVWQHTILHQWNIISR